MKLIAYTLFILMLLFMSNCTLGPDWSPDVTAHAASWSATPTYSPSGVMLAPGNRSSQTRSTMLHP